MAPRQAAPRTVRANVWRMLGIGALLLIVMYSLILGIGRIQFVIFPIEPLVAAALANLIGVRRLAAAPSGRVLIEAMSAVGALAVPGA